MCIAPSGVFCFFFNDTATTEIYTLSLHDSLPICLRVAEADEQQRFLALGVEAAREQRAVALGADRGRERLLGDPERRGAEREALVGLAAHDPARVAPRGQREERQRARGAAQVALALPLPRGPPAVEMALGGERVAREPARWPAEAQPLGGDAVAVRTHV